MQLQNFLTASWAEQVAAAVAAADAAAKAGRGQVPAYDAGICGGWQAVGPCHKQRYLRYAPGQGDAEGGAAAAAVGGLLAQLRDELFSTAAFARLLTKVGRAAGQYWEGCGGLPGCWRRWQGVRTLLAPATSRAMPWSIHQLYAQPSTIPNRAASCSPPRPLRSSPPLGWRASRARCGASAPAWTTQWRTTACSQRTPSWMPVGASLQRFFQPCSLGHSKPTEGDSMRVPSACRAGAATGRKIQLLVPLPLAVLCFVATSEDYDKEAWLSGEVGGRTPHLLLPWMPPRCQAKSRGAAVVLGPSRVSPSPPRIPSPHPPGHRTPGGRLRGLPAGRRRQRGGRGVQGGESDAALVVLLDGWWGYGCYCIQCCLTAPLLPLLLLLLL